MAHSLWCLARYVLWTLLMLPTAFVAMLVTLRADASIWVARRLWSPFCMSQAGARLRVRGGEHVDAARPTLYVANHQSGLDITALFIAIPVNFRFICKNELKYIPLFGWYLWIAGHVFVDRGRTGKAIASLKKAGAQMRRGTSVVVFPEGTRAADGELLPFKKGAFHLAAEAKVAICPVTIEGTAKVAPRDSWSIQPGDVTVTIGKPLLPDDYADLTVEQLSDRVRNAMLAQSSALRPTEAQPPRREAAAA